MAKKIILSLAILYFIFATSCDVVQIANETNPKKRDSLEIYVFNVGEAMSQLIISPTGKSILIDCPESNWNSNTISKFIASEIKRITGNTHINYIVASHLHLDHIGYVGYGGIWGLIEKEGITCDVLLDRNAGKWIDYNDDKIPDYSNEIVYYNGGNLTNTAKRWICWVTDPRSKAGNIRQIAKLDSTTQIDIGLSEGVIVKIVQVDGYGVKMTDNETSISGDHTKESFPPSENDYSMTLWIKWNKFDYIFGSDTDGQYQKSPSYTYNDVESIVAKKINQQVEILNVNHHGAGYSSNNTYVTTLKPQVAIYQVGDNSYGHPEQRVLDLFYQNNVDQYLTAMGDINRNYYNSVIVNGTILIKVAKNDSYTVNKKSYTSLVP